jgi:hypothetical protein
MKLKRGSFRPEDLVLVTEPIYQWGCPGCYAKLMLKREDPRASGELAPRCERCGTFMCAFPDDDRDPLN